MARGRRTNGQVVLLKRAFLESFRVTGNITESCQAVGIGSATTIRNWQEHDDDFLFAYREAEVKATEYLETEARLRATEGSEEPVFHNGKVVGHVRKKSDTLLIFLLKARAPEKYRDRIDIYHHTRELAQQIADEFDIPIERVYREAGITPG